MHPQSCYLPTHSAPQTHAIVTLAEGCDGTDIHLREQNSTGPQYCDGER